MFSCIKSSFPSLREEQKSLESCFQCPHKGSKGSRNFFFFLLFYFFIYLFFKEPPICFPTIGLSHSGRSSFLSFAWCPAPGTLEMGSGSRSSSRCLYAVPAGFCRAGAICRSYLGCCSRHLPWAAVVHAFKSHLLLLVSGFNDNLPLSQ